MKILIFIPIVMFFFLLTPSKAQAKQLDGCKWNPHFPDVFNTGVAFGIMLSEGYGIGIDAANSLAAYTTKLSENQRRLAQMDFVFGMGCGDPTDVNLESQKSKVPFKIDWSTEILVNCVLGMLEGFSRAPRFSHRQHTIELKGEIQKANSFLRERLDPNDVETFVKDFNRRRSENNWLPGVAATIREDGVELRAIHK